ncbi:MAG TPA: matrixin family metalloprotease, partial [Bacteroidetes bacterium]|nr:matrixin family metalloprotease [Bacteroidota bacterium]
SGLWRIEPFFPAMPCEVEVEIDYSLFATTVLDEFRTFGLAQADSITSGGTRNWYIVDGIDTDTSLTKYGISHEKVENVAKAAFCDWERATGINFEYKGIVPSHSSEDDKYTIYFQNLGIGTLMFSDVRRQFYICDSSQYLGGRIIDGDFAVNSYYPWFFNHEDTIGLGSSSAYDFYSVLLHEIGHSLGLEHSMDLDSNGYYDTKIMYYRDTLLQDRRTIDDKSANGVKWLIEKTKLEVSNANGCFSNGFTISTSSALAACNSTTPTHNVSHTPCRILVNNVVQKGENLQLEGNVSKNHEVTIFSVTGQPILRTFLSDDIRVPIDLSGGMYFLQWKCNGRVFTDKFIVQ